MILMEVTGEPMITLKHTCGDSAQDFDDITGWKAQHVDGQTHRNVTGLILTVEDEDIRIAWGTAPTQAGLGLILIAGSSIKLTNHKQIIGLKFINKTNGADATIQVARELSNV